MGTVKHGRKGEKLKCFVCGKVDHLKRDYRSAHSQNSFSNRNTIEECSEKAKEDNICKRPIVREQEPISRVLRINKKSSSNKQIMFFEQEARTVWNKFNKKTNGLP